MSFGKRIEMNNIGVETRGVCTIMCPYTCKMMASSSCNCKNNDCLLYTSPSPRDS